MGVKATGQGKEICGLCKCAKDAEGDKSLFVRTENNLTVQPTLFCLLTNSKWLLSEKKIKNLS